MSESEMDFNCNEKEMLSKESGMFGKIFVQFQTHYYTCKENQCLSLCGSDSRLGEWNTREALLAEEIPEYSGKWSVTIELPVDVSFEWKWVVVWRENNTAFRWEERQNRIFEKTQANSRVFAPWNCDAVFEAAASNGAVWTEADNRNLEIELTQTTDDDNLIHRRHPISHHQSSEIINCLQQSTQSLQTLSDDNSHVTCLQQNAQNLHINTDDSNRHVTVYAHVMRTLFYRPYALVKNSVLSFFRLLTSFFTRSAN